MKLRWLSPGGSQATPIYTLSTLYLSSAVVSRAPEIVGNGGNGVEGGFTVTSYNSMHEKGRKPEKGPLYSFWKRGSAMYMTRMLYEYERGSYTLNIHHAGPPSI